MKISNYTRKIMEDSRISWVLRAVEKVVVEEHKEEINAEIFARLQERIRYFSTNPPRPNSEDVAEKAYMRFIVLSITMWKCPDKTINHVVPEVLNLIKENL